MPAAPFQPQDASSAQPARGGHAATAATAADLEDLRLVQAIRNGEPRAWHQLLTRYQDRLYGVCLRTLGDSARNRQTAADLTQDAMVKIIQGLWSYDGSAKLSTWVIKVTMNVCLSHLRSQKLRRHTSLDGDAHLGGVRSTSGGRVKPSPLSEALAGREPQPEQRVSQEQARAHLFSALTQMEPEQRAILVLRDANGLDYHQIAEVLGVPVGTVKSRIFRARMALRELIEQAADGRRRQELG